MKIVKSSRSNAGKINCWSALRVLLDALKRQAAGGSRVCACVVVSHCGYADINWRVGGKLRLVEVALDQVMQGSRVSPCAKYCTWVSLPFGVHVDLSGSFSALAGNEFGCSSDPPSAHYSAMKSQFLITAYV
jgi:hypothetical protein